MIIHGKAYKIALFWFFLVGVPARSESVPANIPAGFLTPLVETSNLTQRLTIGVTTILPSGDGYFLQRRMGLNVWNWSDVSAPLKENSFFEVDGPVGMSLYRLKCLHPGEETISLTIRGYITLTNRMVSFPFLAGWQHLLQTQQPGTDDWEDFVRSEVTNGFINLPSLLTDQAVRIVARPPIERESYEAVFVGGQSNALISDNTYHPDKDTNVVYIDHELRFRHPARFYDGLKNYPWAYSFASGAASALSKHTGRKYMLVGVAVGGTPMSQWMPGEDRFDRATLFGQANFRRVAAAPQPVRAIWYYGHESSGGYPSAPNYLTEWKRLMGEWQKELGPVPVIFAQLAKSTNPDEHRFMFTATEQQRLSEEGQSEGTEGHHMVVTFDLPLGDGLHLSGEANRILGTRFERAMREHIYGEAVDGTGPRLVSVTRVDELVIGVTFTQVINEPVNGYDNQFRVADENGLVTVIGYDRVDDGRSIHLRLRRRTEGIARVSYGEPGATGDLVYLTNVVRNAEGLPAPAFGPLEVR